MAFSHDAFASPDVCEYEKSSNVKGACLCVHSVALKSMLGR